MNRLIEIILGLDRGFLSREGEFYVAFNPSWPGQSWTGAASWNIVLLGLAVALVVYVYRRDSRRTAVRISLGALRLLLIALVIALLNRPVLTLLQSRTEPSVLAVLIDDSASMKVRDATTQPSSSATTQSTSPTRLVAATELLTGDDLALVKELSKTHELRFYRFDSDASPLLLQQTGKLLDNAPAQDAIAKQLTALEPLGSATQISRSLRTVLQDLQGQRLAGIVILTDGRETPAQPISQALAALKEFGVKLYPIAIGSDSPAVNVVVQSVTAQEAAFKGDIVNVKATLRAEGIPAGKPVTIQLKDKATGQIIRGNGGRPVEQQVTLTGDTPTEVELQFRADKVGTLDLVVQVEQQPGEIDDQDNVRMVQIAVLDEKIAVLYVDGTPRWDYRYIKNEMIRDATVDISCLLTSADPSFRQEGDRPITRFPETIEELLTYDVVLFGDVDPRQFSDRQLQLVYEFVGQKGGGFGMVAGPRFSPQAFRGTPIEMLLPVSIAGVRTEEGRGNISQGFRPIVTTVGLASSIFRFLPDKVANDKFLKEQWQPIFWYCRGLIAKPGVGEVYAEHPSESGPDGRKAPLLVIGRYGSGRTMFSAIDDSWRWRFYTGESVFDTYWVQQLRLLSRGKKLGQRRMTLVASRPSYELGEQVRLTMRVIDPQLLSQLPEQIRVDVVEESGVKDGTLQPTTATSGPTSGPANAQATGGGRVVRQELLVRQEGQSDTYAAAFTADHAGRYTARVPAPASGVEPLETPIEVTVPQLELSEPQVDTTTLDRLATETLGQSVPFAQARQTLPGLITSAARVIPIESSRPLWDAPLAMVAFILLITAEWIGRKVYGLT